MTPNKPRQNSSASRGQQGSPPNHGGGPIEVLPCAVRDLVQNHLRGINPGLRLDQCVKPGKMDQQQEQLRELRLSEDAADAAVHREVMARRKTALAKSEVWTRHTSDSLALHLARASVLENASICLHPVYGFPYLPGTGLKGLARAWAETVWSQSQPDPQQAWNKIHAIFGVGDETDTVKYENGSRVSKPWMPTGFTRRKDSDGKDIDSAGVVVFHDAWPTTPPKLQIDFATPHHKAYYEKSDPPGDWENPEPAAFLSVPAGCEFQFAISPTSRCSDPKLVEEARNWLNDALTIFGAGAKTNAGYGTFVPLGASTAKLPENRFACSTHKLTLTTPAFFAGDQSNAESCRLRGGTLRGLMRWWWRTMHAGYLDAKELHKLEKTIWGGITVQTDKGTSSSTALRIAALRETEPIKYSKQDTLTGQRLPGPASIAGFSYLSYGMDEAEKIRKPDGSDVKMRKQRYYMPEGTEWQISIRSRKAEFCGDDNNIITISAMEVQQQVESALWLLAHFGGLGAKSRKGFGSVVLDQTSPINLNERIADIANQSSNLRKLLELRTEPRTAGVPGSVNDLISTRFLDLPVCTGSAWSAINLVGETLRDFLKANASAKIALGLPRKGISAADVPLRPVKDQKDIRHASPVHHHFYKQAKVYHVRVCAFPSPYLPNKQKCLEEIQKYFECLKTRFSSQNPPIGQGRVPQPPATIEPAKVQRSPVMELPKPGTELEAELVERTPRGSWRVRLIGSGIRAHIDNKVPESAAVGERAKVRIKYSKPNETAVSYLRKIE